MPHLPATSLLACLHDDHSVAAPVPWPFQPELPSHWVRGAVFAALPEVQQLAGAWQEGDPVSPKRRRAGI